MKKLINIPLIFFVFIEVFGIFCFGHNAKIGLSNGAQYIEENFRFSPITEYSPLELVKNKLQKKSQIWDYVYENDLTLYQYGSTFNVSDFDPYSDDSSHTIEFTAFDSIYQLELEPVQIAHPQAKVVIRNGNGSAETFSLVANTFRGTVRQNNTVVGSCAVQMYNSTVFDGSFDVYGKMFTIKLVSVYNKVKSSHDIDVSPEHAAQYRMIVFPTASLAEEHWVGKQKRSTLTNLTNPNWCAVDQNTLQVSASSLRRQNTLRKRATGSGCPQTPKVIYMTVVADCTYVSYYGGALAALSQIVSDWNAASNVYSSTFRVSLGIINVEIEQTCATSSNQNMNWNTPCSSNYPISQRLSDFSYWRGQISDSESALYHLMTSCSTGVSVGIAWVNQLCNRNAVYQSASSAYVTGAAISSVGIEEWKVVAHEVGHNFGAIHDCTDSLCLQNGQNSGLCRPCGSGCDCQGKYIMNPTQTSETDQFSDYSVNDICTALAGTDSSCLMDPGSLKTFSMGQCGNGIKEESEECDCGLNCDNDPCCDGSTCKLKGNATCDDLNDVCCASCQIKPKNTLCRAAVSQCDYSEYCDGSSASCPADTHVANGVFCGPGLQCTSGYCTSRDQQCLSHGADYNVTGSCSTMVTACNMICGVPQKDQCLVLSRNFMDGTVCGYHSFCYRGDCVSPSTFAKMITWFVGHPVPAAVIAVLFFCVCIGVVYSGLHYVLYGRPNAPLAIPSTAEPTADSQAELLASGANSHSNLPSRSSSFNALDRIADDSGDYRNNLGSSSRHPSNYSLHKAYMYPGGQPSNSRTARPLNQRPSNVALLHSSNDNLNGYTTPEMSNMSRAPSSNQLNVLNNDDSLISPSTMEKIFRNGRS